MVVAFSSTYYLPNILTAIIDVPPVPGLLSTGTPRRATACAYPIKKLYPALG